MSKIITTLDNQKFRAVNRNGTISWLWQCKCGEWCSLSDYQWCGLDHENLMNLSIGCWDCEQPLGVIEHNSHCKAEAWN